MTATMPGVGDVADLRDLYVDKPARKLRYGNVIEDNTTRASWAASAFVAYSDRVGEDDFESTMSDLFADLMHLSDGLGLDHRALIQTAARNYEAELESVYP